MDMMKNKEDWKFDKDKASKALQTLSCHVNPFRDENVADIEFKRFRLSIKKIDTLKIKKLNMKFEENRFFPVQYANQFL